MGSAKAAQEAKDMAEVITERQNVARRKRELENKLKSLDAQISALRSEFETQEEELDKLTSEDALSDETRLKTRSAMARMRGSDASK
jgi:circadian clock protein KaiC